MEPSAASPLVSVPSWTYPQLPELPAHYAAASAHLDRARTAEGIAALQVSPAAAGRVLSLAQASCFEAAAGMSSLAGAADFLGHRRVADIVRTVGLQVALEHAGPTDLIRGVHQHARLVGRIARAVAPTHLRDDAFLAGCLHDVGRVTLALSGETAGRVALAHASAAAAALAWIGLPDAVVDAVAGHDQPSYSPAEMDVAFAVHLADALAHEISPWGTAPPAPSRELLEARGVADAWPAWRHAARAAAAAV